jgi:hypothetical protein
VVNLLITIELSTSASSHIVAYLGGVNASAILNGIVVSIAKSMFKALMVFGDCLRSSVSVFGVEISGFQVLFTYLMIHLVVMMTSLVIGVRKLIQTLIESDVPVDIRDFGIISRLIMRVFGFSEILFLAFTLWMPWSRSVVDHIDLIKRTRSLKVVTIDMQKVPAVVRGELRYDLNGAYISVPSMGLRVEVDMSKALPSATLLQRAEGIKECSIATSYFQESRFPESLATLVVGTKPMGMASRVKYYGMDCLMTAYHVLDAIKRDEVSILKDNKAIRMDPSWPVVGYSPSMDFALVRVPIEVFSVLGVKLARFAKPVNSTVAVKVYGNIDGRPHMSIGNCVPSKKAFRLEHRASTTYSWSGSPIFTMRGEILGIHLERAKDDSHNIGICIPTFLIEGKESAYDSRVENEMLNEDFERFEFPEETRSDWFYDRRGPLNIRSKGHNFSKKKYRIADPAFQEDIDFGTIIGTEAAQILDQFKRSQRSYELTRSFAHEPIGPSWGDLVDYEYGEVENGKKEVGLGGEWVNGENQPCSLLRMATEVSLNKVLSEVQLGIVNSDQKALDKTFEEAEIMAKCVDQTFVDNRIPVMLQTISSDKIFSHIGTLYETQQEKQDAFSVLNRDNDFDLPMGNPMIPSGEHSEQYGKIVVEAYKESVLSDTTNGLMNDIWVGIVSSNLGIRALLQLLRGQFGFFDLKETDHTALVKKAFAKALKMVVRAGMGEEKWSAMVRQFISDFVLAAVDVVEGRLTPIQIQQWADQFLIEAKLEDTICIIRGTDVWVVPKTEQMERFHIEHMAALRNFTDQDRDLASKLQNLKVIDTIPVAQKVAVKEVALPTKSTQSTLVDQGNLPVLAAAIVTKKKQKLKKLKKIPPTLPLTESGVNEVVKTQQVDEPVGQASYASVLKTKFSPKTLILPTTGLKALSPPKAGLTPKIITSAIIDGVLLAETQKSPVLNTSGGQEPLSPGEKKRKRRKSGKTSVQDGLPVVN